MKWLGYSSNNSGGGWWLKDEDWKALEAAGWTVNWHASNKSSYSKPDKEGRWLGALAGDAFKQFETAAEGIREWERVTGKDSTDEGCNCCGPPHSFHFGEPEKGGIPKGYYDIQGEYWSGEEIVKVLFDQEPMTARQFAEAMKERRER